MHEMSRNERESSEERKLELRLAPPGVENWFHTNNNNKQRDLDFDSNHKLSLGSSNYFSTNNTSSFLHFPSTQQHVRGKESSSSQACCPKLVDLENGGNNKVTAVSNTSQKRTAPGPVVGWPPIRSFRKNLATSSISKPTSQTESQTQHHQNKVVAGKKPIDNNYGGKGLFVKINMDGVPIGRKVDLKAYHSYENLSIAVDELFRGLLKAQGDSSGCGSKKNEDEEKVISGILDGSGEYTLVYEDNEGDRMLVGDVPWHMFVSTVKRLRVLKSTELSAFTLGAKQEKICT
ncbi:auxin-responsive protein IAA26-like [Vicia villosa]|uniref:auxin-responsive protein IAA26-like n=1 Tax=Vicia villosa TaxID=3911 RepID=UPI00273B2712|nr:auxin-responsive protein IAA26-like [Vicia villosa]XP_058774180.1 auxin-responsive protein IAA26-like [Vicia villosa]